MSKIFFFLWFLNKWKKTPLVTTSFLSLLVCKVTMNKKLLTPGYVILLSQEPRLLICPLHISGALSCCSLSFHLSVTEHVLHYNGKTNDILGL